MTKVAQGYNLGNQVEFLSRPYNQYESARNFTGQNINVWVRELPIGLLRLHNRDSGHIALCFLVCFALTDMIYK